MTVLERNTMHLRKTNFKLTHKLQEYRESRDWSQGMMAKYLTLRLNDPVSLPTISAWETGKRRITPERAVELSAVLNIDLSELVTRD